MALRFSSLPEAFNHSVCHGRPAWLLQDLNCAGVNNHGRGTDGADQHGLIWSYTQNGFSWSALFEVSGPPVKNAARGTK